ncbi:uncharacterized protein RJT21DRAFT_118336 [Scheffersomyces amazonensis]|uniref:uncharacterized protein n=1 Tax=Scheffersomyces amazonensis TaxID=1078765 RepID=UPI00315C54F9
MIGQDFEQLSENYYSLNEIYNKDITYTESLYSSFKKWDNNRLKILSKIQNIKSINNKHGAKLAGLLDESNAIDEEISQLEAQLRSLTQKKNVINKEIQVTTSVLESKTSKYVNMFKSLEVQGREAVQLLLQANGIPETESESVLKFTPVKVTFLDNYKSESKSVFTPTPPPPQPEAKPEAKPKPTPKPKAEPIGMQPFIIPEPEPQPQPSKIPKETQAEWNHGHGPTAYEKGFAEGTQSSIKLKNKLNSVIKLLLKSLPRTDSPETVPSERIPSYDNPIIDDKSNTVTEKLNLEPIFKLLHHKSEALNDLLLSTSRKATIYHEYSIAWKDIIAILKSQEQNFSFQVSNSVSNSDHLASNVCQTLTSTINQTVTVVREFKNILNDSSTTTTNPFKIVVNNELETILKVLRLVCKDNKYEREVTELTNQLKSIGLV